MQIFGPSLGTDPIADAIEAEELGYSGVRVLDHLFCAINDGPINTFDHPLVVLGAAAAVTSEVLLTQTMLDVTRRHPTEVAQAIATLDRLSGGRAELGLGAGWYLPEHDAVGIELGRPGIRVERLIEALDIIRQMFTGQGVVDFDGDHFTAHVDTPWAPTVRTVPIVVGASRPRLVKAAARFADRLEILAPDPRPGDDFRLDADVLAGYLESARAVAADAGHPLDFSARVTLRFGDTPTDLSDPLTVTGSPDDVLSTVEHLASLGFSRLTVLPLTEEAEAWTRSHVAELRQIEPVPAPV